MDESVGIVGTRPDPRRRHHGLSPAPARSRPTRRGRSPLTDVPALAVRPAPTRWRDIVRKMWRALAGGGGAPLPPHCPERVGS